MITPGWRIARTNAYIFYQPASGGRARLNSPNPSISAWAERGFFCRMRAATPRHEATARAPEVSVFRPPILCPGHGHGPTGRRYVEVLSCLCMEENH